MANFSDQIPAPLKSLWNFETELRSAAQHAIFMDNAEASQHLDQARSHLNEALKSLNLGKPAPPPVTPSTP